MKKCKPFECVRFKRTYERISDKLPADILIVKCPYRIGEGINCQMED